MRRDFFLGIGFILFIGMLGGQTPDDEGLAHFKNKNFDQARSYYERILNEDPENQAAWFGLGVTAYNQKDQTSAATAFDRATAGENTELTAAALYNLGFMANDNKKTKESLALFRKSLELNPGDLDAKFNYELLKYLANKNQSEKSDSQPQPEPSEEAKKIKKLAEELVKKHQYAEALDLMNDLLRRDKTAATFQDFTKRIEDITKILKEAA